jgi:glycosyltransferase involved in cell wall biosynthesis
MQPIRLVVQEPALPKYRVAFFRELARRPEIKLKVFYSDTPNLPNADPEGFEGIHVPVRRKMLFGRPFAWSVSQWRCAGTEEADVLLLEWDLHYLSLVPSLLRARLRGLPVVLWGHGYSKNEAALREFLRRKVGQLGTAGMFYNYIAAGKFIERGWAPERCHVALNSLDQAPIQAAREAWLQDGRLDQFKREQGIADVPTILFVSRLEPDNRVDLLIQSAHELRKFYPNLRVHIIGKGRDQENLQSLVQSLGLTDHIRFLGAIYDEMKLAPWFLSANLFCYPANIGLSILHAFGYGLPVVTSDRVESQNPEIEAMRHEENGLLYADGDLGALTNALRRILDDRGFAHQLSEGAHRTVMERFNMEKMVDGCVGAIKYAYSKAGY